jgi:predicted nucleotidyltransferase component of viral defense system
MIPPRNISIVSNRLFKEHGGRRIPEQVIELDYCLAWFLAELATHPLNTKLAFKGGTCLRRCHFGEYRFSEDLDFTLISPIDFSDIQVGLAEIFSDLKARSGISMAYKEPDRNPHQNSHTFYISYTGPQAKQRDVKVDMTISERIVLPLEKKSVIKTYDEFADLPEGQGVTCYSVGEVAIEKIAALSDKARKQPRDLYDLWYLTESNLVDIEQLGIPLVQKLEHRGRIIDDVEGAIVAKEKELKRLWTARLEPQMAELPEFDDVFRAVRRTIRQANLQQFSAGVTKLTR